MAIKRALRPTNRRIRVVVGLLLAGLFCIQCTHSGADRAAGRLAVPISGQIIGENAPDVLAEVDRLAKTDQIALLEYCLKSYQGRIQDYTCTFVKQEKVHGKMSQKQVISVKFMESPFSVVLAWVENAPAGDRVLYVEGKYDGKMVVRPKVAWQQFLTGGSVLREPDGDEAMKNTLRPVNMFGFKRGVENLLHFYRKARKHGDLREEFGNYVKLDDGRRVVKIIRWLPAKMDYPACKTIIMIDMETLLPVVIEGYDWDGELTSQYIYKDVKLNVGLSEKDFTPAANGITGRK